MQTEDKLSQVLKMKEQSGGGEDTMYRLKQAHTSAYEAADKARQDLEHYQQVELIRLILRPGTSFLTFFRTVELVAYCSFDCKPF